MPLYGETCCLGVLMSVTGDKLLGVGELVHADIILRFSEE